MIQRVEFIAMSKFSICLVETLHFNSFVNTRKDEYHTLFLYTISYTAVSHSPSSVPCISQTAERIWEEAEVLKSNL